MNIAQNRLLNQDNYNNHNNYNIYNQQKQKPLFNNNYNNYNQQQQKPLFNNNYNNNINHINQQQQYNPYPYPYPFYAPYPMPYHMQYPMQHQPNFPLPYPSSYPSYPSPIQNKQPQVIPPLFIPNKSKTVVVSKKNQDNNNDVIKAPDFSSFPKIDLPDITEYINNHDQDNNVCKSRYSPY